MKSPLVWFMLSLIRFYQRFISPLSQPRCKFYPTCSTYSYQAICTHGVIKGSLLSIIRLLRCHPWSLGGVDYVPKKGSWHRPRYYSMSEEELHMYWEELDKVSSEKDRQYLIDKQLISNYIRANS